MEIVYKLIFRGRNHPFFIPFLPSIWNVNVMAGALEALLDPEDVIKLLRM